MSKKFKVKHALEQNIKTFGEDNHSDNESAQQALMSQMQWQFDSPRGFMTHRNNPEQKNNNLTTRRSSDVQKSARNFKRSQQSKQ